MKPSVIKVLNVLRKKRRKGVTFDDFHRGFRLAAYIFNLREAGYTIATDMEPMSNGGRRARYVLIGEPNDASAA